MIKKHYLALAAAALLGACSDDTSNGGMNASGADMNGENCATPGSAADLQQNVGDRVFFGFDKSHLTEESKQTLEKQAAFFRTYPHNVTVNGYCDKRGTREYNLALSERRANAARNYLIALGIDANRLRTLGWGKDKLIVQGDNEEVHAQNRVAITAID